MSAVKKVCINSAKNYYMGTELSPLHYGLSAEGYDINSIMEGYDKELWIVDVKNNKKVWVKNENLSRITHEEPVIKNILSLYCDAEDIEKMNQLKQKCGKDGSYNLKDIKKFYNVCDDDCDDSRENEADESGKETECSGADQEDKDNICVIGAGNQGAMSTLSNEDKEDNMPEKTLVSNGAKCITGGNIGDENYDGDVDLDDILKGAKGAKGGKGGKSRKGPTKKTVAKATAATAAIAEGKKADANCAANDGEKCAADGDDKKPTDYNIFVKFRLNELKEISTNKKDNFENVKIEWRELKKNKGELKIVMEKAYLWLNQDK